MTFDLSADSAAKSLFPALPLDEWENSKETLHRYAQIVGKVRLGCCAPANHWWKVTLYLSSRGLSTGPNPYGAWRSLSTSTSWHTSSRSPPARVVRFRSP
jgi:hypothetical protein